MERNTNKVLRMLKALASVLWQLPQECIALLVYVYLRLRGLEYTQRVNERAVLVVSRHFRGGLSLGHFIFLSRASVAVSGSKSIRHEYGHCLQSLRLGWLYLFVIGLPSLAWATLHTYSEKWGQRDYYSFYTEAWADKLGGVQR